MPPRLLLFTDTTAPRRHGRCVLSTVARAFADVVVDTAADVAVCVRDKAADTDAISSMCAAIVDVVAVANVRVLVHGHVDVAAALGLAGVHLPSTATTNDVRLARLRLPRGALVGVSAHPTTAAPHSTRDDVDYVTWSPIFSPASKADTRVALGLQALRGHRTPVIALGGVDVDSAAACFDNGAVGVAAIGAVFGVADPGRALQAMLRACGIGFRPRRRGRQQTMEHAA